MRATTKIAGCILVTVSVFAFASTGSAMTFEIVGETIFAEGEINDGDTLLFFSSFGGGIKSDVDKQYTMQLNSPGGSLLEGLRLGQELNARAIKTRVSSIGECYSACAIAFLGGTLQYATATGSGRELEWGAHLGFHGYYADGGSVQVKNETLSEVRVINSVLIAYSQDVGGIDYEWIADALTFPPSELKLVNTKKSIDALSILISGGPDDIPEDWDRPLCSSFVAAGDGGNNWGYDRVSKFYKTISKISEIRSLTADVVFEDSEIGSLLRNVGNDSAISLALGGGFDLEIYKPIIDARIREIERGAGFYYDSCISFRSKNSVVTIMVDRVSKNLIWRAQGIREDRIDKGNGTIVLHDDDALLWN